LFGWIRISAIWLFGSGTQQKSCCYFSLDFLIERFRGGVEPNGCIFAANNSNNSGGARISRWTPPQVVALN
jgi:hypothetical protein